MDFNGRHTPTLGWGEAVAYDISNAAYLAGATTRFTYAIPSGASNVNPAVNDLLYIDVSGVTGTINTMPVGWYTVTAVNTGSNTVTVNYNSTALTYTSGTGVATLFSPDDIYRYGEQEYAIIEGSNLFSHAISKDSHENGYGTMFRNNAALFPIEQTWNGTIAGGVTLRGCCETVDGLRVVRGVTAITVRGTEQQFGMQNVYRINNVHITDQQDRAAAQILIKVEGNSAVTDIRKTIVSNMSVDGGAYAAFYLEADAGDLDIHNFTFNGDWGVSAATAHMFRVGGNGTITVFGGVIDLKGAVTDDDVRIALAEGGKIVFKGTRFTNIASDDTYLFLINAGTTGRIVFEQCTFELLSTATNVRLASVSGGGIVGYFEFKDCKLVNAANLRTTASLGGLMNVNAGTGHLLVEEFSADAAIIYASETAGGVANMTQPTVKRITKMNSNTTAVGNVTTGEDNLITYALPAFLNNGAGSGVRIKAWGTFANNANAKTLKVYYGTQILLTNALTINVAGTWYVEAIVLSTGLDTQDYVANLQSTGAAGVSVTDNEIGTATQNDGAAITIKCTGEATATNDVVQEGMLIELL